MALHPSNNLSANISTLEMMRVIYINEGNYETAQRQLQLFFFQNSLLTFTDSLILLMMMMMMMMIIMYCFSLLMVSNL